MTPLNIYKDSIKEFEEKFVNLCTIVIPAYGENHKDMERTQEVKSHLHSHTIKLLEGVVRELEGRKKDEKTIIVPAGANIGEYRFIHSLRNEGYNEALTDLITHYKSEIELIKKEI